MKSTNMVHCALLSAAVSVLLAFPIEAQSDIPDDHTLPLFFHYELSGQSAGLTARIDLDPFIAAIVPLIRDKPANPEQAIQTIAEFSTWQVTLSNESDASIVLSPYTDLLILAGKPQQQFRPPPPSRAGYPAKLLPRSEVVLRFDVPAGDDRIHLANTAAYLAGYDDWLRQRPVTEEQGRLPEVLTGGEIDLALAGTSIPLRLAISKR